MSCGLPTPGADAPFVLQEIVPSEVPFWFHVYCTERFSSTTATTFAQGWGDTRFAPLKQPDGSPVHTWYGASAPEVAYMESVLHDMPLSPPGVFEVDRLRHFHLARVRISRPLQCVQFHTPYLPKLGLSRAQLIDSLPACYPETRAWAQAAFDQCPNAQALAYGSRRHDAGRCIMLFGQRLPAESLTVLGDEPLGHGDRRTEILALIRRLGVHEI